MIDWDKINKNDSRLVHRIATRAAEQFSISDKQSLVMDIEAAHIAQPLKLQELLNADDANFGHDVFGISRHIDRTTGKMQNCFLPRFSAPTS